MSSESLTMSESSSPAAETDSSALRLWNPRVAAYWSLLFSPAFGAYLHMLNWQKLGKAEKAAEARRWFGMLCGLLVLNLIIAAFAFAHQQENPVPNSIGLVLTAIWYLRSAKPQEQYVAEVQGGDYVRNGWAKPVFVAIGAALAYVILTVVTFNYLAS